MNIRLLLREHDPRWCALASEDCMDGLMIALEGDLGAGKSAWARHMLRCMGVSGYIPSPTYSLCEEYAFLARATVLHMDAYRLESAASWEVLGLDQWQDKPHSLWIEWCSKHPEYFRLCDVCIEIQWLEDVEYRAYHLSARTVRGERWVQKVKDIFMDDAAERPLCGV